MRDMLPFTWQRARDIFYLSIVCHIGGDST